MTFITALLGSFLGMVLGIIVGIVLVAFGVPRSLLDE